jgi:hypothetical protein
LLKQLPRDREIVVVEAVEAVKRLHEEIVGVPVVRVFPQSALELGIEMRLNSTAGDLIIIEGQD